MKLSRPAILFLVAIWALLLFAPPLNLLLRAQLHGSNLMPFSVLPGNTPTQEISEADALRFPGDKDVLLQAAFSSPHTERNVVVGWQKVEVPPADESALPIVESYPITTPIFRASPIFPGQPERSSKREQLRRLEILSQKYPRDAMLLAVYLRTAIATYYGRRAEDLTIYKSTEPLPPESEPPPKSEYSSADLLRAIELCERGQKLEADNAFFDWLKSSFLLLAWRDAEALQALNSAARKPRFEDYVLQELQSKRAAFSTVLGRALIVEEKQSVFLWHQLPHLSRYREMARILANHSTKAQRRGEHARALRISANLSRLGEKMRANSTSQIAASNATIIENNAWYAPVYDARQSSRKANESSPRESTQTLFQRYAARHGRNDLVAEAKQNYAAGEALRKSLEADYSSKLLGVPYSIWAAINVLWTGGVLLLLFLPLAVLLPSLMALLARIPRVRKVFRVEETTTAETPSSREIWNGALACGGLRAFFPFLIGWLTGQFFSGSIDFNWANGFRWKSAGLYAATPSPIQEFYFLLQQLTMNEQPSLLNYVLALSPLLFGVLFVAWRATEWQKHANGETTKRFGVLRLLGFIVIILFTVAWLALAFEGSSSSHLIASGFVLFFAGVLLMEKFFIWRKRPRRAATVRYGLRLLQHSLSAWLVLGSALYLMTLLVSLPLRAHADAEVEQVFEVGEVRARMK